MDFPTSLHIDFHAWQTGTQDPSRIVTLLLSGSAMRSNRGRDLFAQVAVIHMSGGFQPHPTSKLSVGPNIARRWKLTLYECYLRLTNELFFSISTIS
jgi:hypothetical protein